MARVDCTDGSRLTLLPVPVLDRDGVPYEVTLRLLRDDEPFGEVGERCGWFVAAAAERVRASDGPPASTLESGLRAWARDADLDADAAWEQLQRYVPRDRELLALRSRDPDDLAASGELRVWLRRELTWVGGEPRGRWQRQDRAVLDAWGDGGTGLRAVLDRAALLGLLDALLADCAAVGVTYDAGTGYEPVPGG